MGPKLPELDDRMRPDTTVKSALAGAGTPVAAGGRAVGTAWTVGSGRIVLITDLSDASAALSAALEPVKALAFERNDPRIDVALHAAADQPGRLVVFVANPTADAIDATVWLGSPVRSARDLWEDRPAEVVDGALHQRMAPYTIAILDCQL
jgi:beta-galactosidase